MCSQSQDSEAHLDCQFEEVLPEKVSGLFVNQVGRLLVLNGMDHFFHTPVDGGHPAFTSLMKSGPQKQHSKILHKDGARRSMWLALLRNSVKQLRFLLQGSLQ